MAFVSAHNWPFIHEFSADDRRLAEDARSELEERKRRSFEARRQKAAEIGEDVRRQLRDLLGAETARELRQLMARERIALRHRRQPPDGLSLDFVEANAARKAKVDRLLQQRGISGERIASIGAAARRKLVQTLSQIEGKVVTGHALSLNLENWKKLSPLNKLSLPWGEWPFDEDPNDPHRWFLFRPPFFGFDWTSFLGREGDFRINRDHIIDPAAGLVGNDVTMDCDDASTFSYDWAWAEVETYTAFGFEAPRAGLIEVLIDAQSALAKHYVKTEDEWGPSDHRTSQDNYLALRVLHPGVPETSFALIDQFITSSIGGTVNDEYLIRGQHYYAQLLSAGSVPGGQTVVIEIGTKTHDTSSVAAVEVHAKSNVHWFISSVQVRIAP